MAIFKKILVLLMPALFAAYSVLALFSYNVQAIKFTDITWILVIAIIIGGSVTGLLYLIFRDRSKVSLIASCWVIIFFSYGQIYNVVHKSLGVYIGRNVILAPLALLLMLFSAFWIWKFVREPSRLIPFFGGMVAVLYLMTFFSLGRFYYIVAVNKSGAATTGQPAAQPTAQGSVNSSDGPSIYYIILDAHGRQDILQELYDYDDSDFIQFLKDKGFFVGEASHSNYIQTLLSLSSTLNMQYLDTIGLPTQDGSAGRVWLADKIKDNLVREILAAQGYKIVSVNSDYETSPTNADIVINFDTAPESHAAKKLVGPSEIDQMFLASTLGRVIIDLGWFPKISDNQQLYVYHYTQTEYLFGKLSEVPDLPGKKFVFAHLMVPHPPFVFAPDGSFKYNPLPYSLLDGTNYPGTQRGYINGYRDQVKYVDDTMEKVITDILARSSPPPIIIIQGDHGPGAYLDWNSADRTKLDERLSILNAYYFPGGHSASLYASITPVNSFRVLLDEYFGMKYPLLADKNYYSTWNQPFTYIDVTARLKK
jgi:hypothetical protein